MSLRLFIAALALGHSAATLAQPAPDVSADAIRADITFLSDDLLEGRDAGSRGYDIAARYVAARFASLGLTQAVPDSWFQPVTLAVADLDPASPAALIIGGKRFDNGGDVIITASGRELKQGIEAQAVFVGYGLQSTRQKIDDYAGLDLKGKFAVALAGAPVGMPSEIGAHLASEKIMAAQRAGAIGLITIPGTAQLVRRPWERMKDVSAGPVVSWVDAQGQPYVRAPAIRGAATAHAAAAQALLAGSGRTLAALRKEADRRNARPRGFALKPLVRIERTSTLSTATSSNVLAVLPGSDPTLAGEYVLLMAHLDHEGIKQSAKGPDKIYNGAMDNASGVATMLAVAKALSQGGTAPRRPILFAAVTAEEDGLIGAHYLARHPTLPAGARVVSVVNLDMPILTYDFSDVVAFGAEHSTLGPIVERAARASGLSCRPIRCRPKGCSPVPTIIASAGGDTLGLPDDRVRRAGQGRFPAVPQDPLSSAFGPDRPAVQLECGGQVRAGQLPDRAGNRRRGGNTALVCR
ncbi:M28 family peptidase [Sphingobium sp. AN641]|uniref:M28 family peptidase n=1 Tax=Sphingobium sp. AN641 TaxID=3133443 RepID=UPI0030C2D379